MNTQYYKTLYFSDHPAIDTRAKSVTIAFNKDEYPYFQTIKKLSNHEIRGLVGIDSFIQLCNIAEKEDRSINNIIKRQLKNNIILETAIQPSDSSFVNSKTIPFQRWYPYIEGYSPNYVISLIQKYLPEGVKTIFDPFVGTGTTIFGADELDIKTIYSEVNPLLQFIIDTKISILKLPKIERRKLAHCLLNVNNEIPNNLNQMDIDIQLDKNYKTLFGNSKYFDEKTYIDILRMRTYIDKIKLTDVLLSNIVTIALMSILIPISLLKKQGDVRYKTKEEILKEKVKFKDVFPKKIIEMADDIVNFDFKINNKPEFIISNAKNIGLINNRSIDAVITSPPYLNGTNYFRNTKLELWFLRYIQYEDDLRYLRDQALTSGINDVNRHDSEINNKNILDNSKILSKLYPKLEKTAYDKRIPVMISNYFNEMYSIFNDILPLYSKKARIIIDIGDSIFGGVHIPTDNILVDLLSKEYNLIEKIEVRERRSRNKMLLHQSLLILEVKNKKYNTRTINKNYDKIKWNKFKHELPHQKLPYSKKNWGHANHSLCSYQGKLKPAIAYHLIQSFIPENGRMLDPFSGVGTIPFEAALNNITSYGIDISLPAYYISKAKVSINDRNICLKYIDQLQNYIVNNKSSKKELEEVKTFGFNKTLSEYYEDKTLQEIILARRFLKENPPQNSSEMLVIASLLHILHGNRPYALSRRSHPIVPYAPQGNFEYKNVIEKLKDKVGKSLNEVLPEKFISGKIFHQDSTTIWPHEINNLDAIITSPPFFDSTRFYLANWIRLWFSGWSHDDFKYQTNLFIEEKQKKDFTIYDNIFRQARERLKKGGVFVLHLGKSKKCDMASELQKISKHWFSTADIFTESVEHCESHGIRDKGTVTSHQYLVLI